MSNLRHFYQVNLFGSPVPQSNINVHRKPVAYGKSQWREFVSVAEAPTCCNSGPLLVTSIHRKDKFYVRLAEATLLPIAGSLQPGKLKPTTFQWQEVVGIHSCATLPQFNVTYTWTGTNPLSINIITLLGKGIGYKSTLVENSSAIPTNEGHMTVDALHSGALTIHQNSAGTSHTDTITLHYSNGTCSIAFQLSLNYTHT